MFGILEAVCEYNHCDPGSVSHLQSSPSWTGLPHLIWISLHGLSSGQCLQVFAWHLWCCYFSEDDLLHSLTSSFDLSYGNGKQLSGLSPVITSHYQATSHWKFSLVSCEIRPDPKCSRACIGWSGRSCWRSTSLTWWKHESVRGFSSTLCHLHHGCSIVCECQAGYIDLFLIHFPYCERDYCPPGGHIRRLGHKVRRHWTFDFTVADWWIDIH